MSIKVNRLPIMNKDHQSQNTDQIRTKMFSKIQTLQTKAKQMQLNQVSSQQYQNKNIIL